MKKFISLLLVLTAVAGISAREVGGDISLLTKYEQHGARYLDQNGTRITTDMLTFFKQQGWTSMRVRLFVDPSKASDEDKGQGVCQDLDYVINLGARIKAAGFTFMLDFHYSDSWADPAKQYTPDAWKDLNDTELTQKIYDYTKDCLAQLVAAGATPDFIQTGNEISYGMLWGVKGSSSLKKCYTTNNANWSRFTTLLASAGRACREVCPNAKIIIHTERVPNLTVLDAFYTRMLEANLDYDIIGLSYYPYYHNKISQLESAVSRLESRFPSKEIMVVETGYFHIYQPSDVTYDLSATYPITPAGQLAFTNALIDMLASHPKVTGLYWWFPEANEYGLNWATNRVTDNWYNAGLWDNGTGKMMPAVSALADFIPDVVGDANGNGIVDVSDLNIIVNIILGLEDAANYPNANVNGTGAVDVADLNMIINIILGAGDQ